MKKLNFDEASELLRQEVAKYMPDHLEQLEIVLGIVLTQHIEQVEFPICCALVGPAGVGKSTLLDMLRDLPEILPRDDLTPAGFLSARTDIDPEEQLINQLPNHVVVCSDLAPILANSDVKKIISYWVRIIDGTGLIRSTGNGTIYAESQMKFGMLMATPRFSEMHWRLFSRMGPRIIMLKLHKSKKSFSDRVRMLAKKSVQKGPRIKISIVRKLVLAFYQNLISTYPDGITWDIQQDSKKTLFMIAHLAEFLSLMRHKFVIEGGDIAEDNEPEDAQRVNRIITDVCRGVALVRGRSHIEDDELSVAIRIAFDSFEPRRLELLNKLLNNGGSISTEEYQKLTGKKRATVYRLFAEFKNLGICYYKKTQTKTTTKTTTKPPKTISLSDDFLWLLNPKVIDYLNRT